MYGQSTVKYVVTFGVGILIGTWMFAGIAFANPSNEAGGVHAARVAAENGQAAAPECGGSPSSTNAVAGDGAGCTGSTDPQATSSEVSLAPAVSATRVIGTAAPAATTSNGARARATEVLGTQVRRDAPALARTGKSTVPLLVLGTSLCLLGLGFLRLSGDKAYR
jgi:hypothetical protein